MMCPDIPANETLQLQGGDHNRDVLADETWFFVIDSCEHFQNITNNTDCKTQAETDAILSNLVIETKILTQFFSPVTYGENDSKMSMDLDTQRIQLSPVTYDRR